MVLRTEANESIGIWKRQRAKQQRTDERGDGRRRCRAQGQAEYRNNRKTGRPSQALVRV